MGKTGGFISLRWQLPCWSSHVSNARPLGAGVLVGAREFHAAVYLTVSLLDTWPSVLHFRWTHAWLPHWSPLGPWKLMPSCYTQQRRCWTAPMSAWRIPSYLHVPLPVPWWHQDLTFSGGFRPSFSPSPSSPACPPGLHSSFSPTLNATHWRSWPWSFVLPTDLGPSGTLC